MNISFIRKTMLLLLPAFVMLVGCNEEDPDSISVVDVVTGEPITTIYADAQEGEYFFKVMADTWSVVSEDSTWCIPQKDGGYTYGEQTSIYVKEYTGTADSRNAYLIFRSGSATHRVQVCQTKGDELVSLYPSTATVDYKAQSCSFIVNSSFDWSVSSSAVWVEAVKSGNNVVLTIDENPTSSVDREATITVLATNNDGGSVSMTTATYILVQKARTESYLTFATDNYSFESGASFTVVDFFTNVYEPEITLSSDEDWCLASYLGNSSINISAVENELVESRSATITVTARANNGTGIDVVSKQIFVTQAGCGDPTITLGESEYTFGNRATSKIINIYGNAATFSAVADTQWIKSTVVDENGETLSFELDENLTSDMREGHITIIAKRGGVSVTEVVTIYQNGVGSLDDLTKISPEDISVDEAAYTSYVTLINNSDSSDLDIEWMAASASWCKVVADEDNMGATITIDSNLDLYERKCSVMVRIAAGDQVVVKSLTVTQKGKSTTPIL